MSTHATLSTPADAGAQPFDFRGGAPTPHRQLAVLEHVLGLARERAAGSLSTLLRTGIRIDHATTELVSYGEYVRALPVVSVLTEVALEPLQGHAILELDTSLALMFIEQLMGGEARPSAPRRLTSVERSLLGELTGPVLGGVVDALEPVVTLQPRVIGTATDPRFVDLVPTTEPVILLVMQVTLTDLPGEPAGLMTLCAPAQTLAPLLDRLVPVEEEPTAPATPTGPLASILPDVKVGLRVHLSGTPSSLTDIVGLQVGDVLRLDHRVDQPVTGSIGDHDVLQGHLGRRGSRFAVRVSAVLAPAPAAPVAPSTSAPQPTPPAAASEGALHP